MQIYKNRRSITTVNKHLPFVWRVNYLHEASTPEIMPEIAHVKALLPDLAEIFLRRVAGNKDRRLGERL